MALTNQINLATHTVKMHTKYVSFFCAYALCSLHKTAVSGATVHFLYTHPRTNAYEHLKQILSEVRLP